MVVDDDELVRSTVCAFLDRAGGWTVVEAQNGREALARLDRTVDVMLLDRDMPKVTGPEVVERLDETTFSGPIVVLSCSSPDDELGRSEVTTYLTKPTDFGVVVDELDRAAQE